MDYVAADGSFIASWHFTSLLSGNYNTDPADWENFRVLGNAPVTIVSGGDAGNAHVELQYDDPVTGEGWEVVAGPQVPQFDAGPIPPSTGTVT